ncbi:hypothetical protein ACWKWU_17725 [Chitinophaga lutea]
MKRILWITLMTLTSISAWSQDTLPSVHVVRSQDMRWVYMDSVNHHTALRPFLWTDNRLYDELYDQPHLRKRSWAHRKLFDEHLLEFRNADYNVFVDFLPDFNVGRSNSGKTTWLNTRGAMVQGNIGSKFYFESSFFENQGVFPSYIDSFVAAYRVLPGQGEPKVKTIGKSYDFAYVNALIAYKPSQYLDFKLGYGTNSYGDGYRSLILSDIGFSYPYLKVTGTLGQFQYAVMWAQFMDLSGQSYDQAYRDLGYNKKWGVFHFLDWNVSKRLTIGLFDAVIWADSDSSGRKRGFDWSYLNPIIFLRPAEASTGSSDNAMVGGNIKYKLGRKTLAYGQFVLDEFRLGEFFSGDGWWGNKWALQTGIRTFDFLRVPKLDLRGEFNMARPYTYSFRNGQGNYAHFNQPLAHPMGANFVEGLGIAEYAYRRWHFRGQLTYAQYGLDGAVSDDFGKDIFKSYEQRKGDYDIRMLQGLKTDFLFGQGTVAFVLNPMNNLRLELSLAGRQEKNSLGSQKELIFQFGLRSSFRKLYYDY